MKKIALTTLLFIFIGFSSACSNDNSNTLNYVQSDTDYYQYELNESIESYDIDDKGNLYYVTNKIIGYETYLINGENQELPKTETYINVLNPEGMLVDFYTAPEVSSIFLENDKILHTVNSDHGLFLKEFNKITQSSETISEFTDYTAIMKAETIDGYLYFIGFNNNYINKDYSLASYEDHYNYSGERIGYINLSTGALEELPVELPISISKNLEGNLVIYAYDQEKGYYFTIYDIVGKSFSDNIYLNMGQLRNFNIFNKNNDFIYLDLTTTTFSLTAASLNPDIGKKDLIPNILVSDVGIKCKGEYTYFTDINLKNIIRIQNSSYLRENKKIMMLSNNIFHNYAPFGCGYNMQHEATTDEEMALLMLSQDSNFDLYSMNSRQDISANVRDKGSFYPLNDVTGVEEYLDLCFPYIKDAAINSDGDIWMLPIYIDIPSYLYNETVCKENDIEFSDSMEVDYFLDVLAGVKQNSSLTNMYFNLEYTIVQNFIYQYLSENTNFDTSLFKDIAAKCKANLNYKESSDFGNDMLQSDFQLKNATNFLYLFRDDNSTQMRFSNDPNLRATSIPSITDNKNNIATCYFLAVNPASKNLKETLQYISSLSKYLTSIHTTLMSKDRANYPDTKVMEDLYNIYMNGDIQFTYPEELFITDFERYLAGEIDLEQVIKDSNRRLDTFLKE